MRLAPAACLLFALIPCSGCATSFAVSRLGRPQVPEKGHVVAVRYGEGGEATYAQVDVEWSDGTTTRETAPVEGLPPIVFDELKLEERRRRFRLVDSHPQRFLVPVRTENGAEEELDGCAIPAPERAPSGGALVAMCAVLPFTLIADLAYTPFLLIFPGLLPWKNDLHFGG